MGITAQLVFQILAIAAFVVATVFAALAAYAYVHEDIRAVRDDLRGRRRMDQSEATRTVVHRRAPANVGVPAAPPSGVGTGATGADSSTAGFATAPNSGSATAPNSGFATAPNSGFATAPNSGFSTVPNQTTGVMSNEDAVATVVSSEFARRMAESAPTEENTTGGWTQMGAPQPIEVPLTEDDPDADTATVVFEAPEPDASLFRLTRRVVSIGSSEVIAVV